MAVASAAPNNKRQLWHSRFCHRVERSYINAIENRRIEGINLSERDIMLSKVENKCVCDICARAKSTKQARVKVADPRSHAGEVSTDLYGPFAEPTIQGSYYLQVFVRIDSKFRVIYGLKRKKEVEEKLQDYLKTWTDTTHYHPDGAAELISSEIRKILIERNPPIGFTYSAAYTPNQNAHAERSWGILSQMALAVLLESRLPFPFCEFAFLYACWIANRLPANTDRGRMSPYEFHFDTIPDMSMARRWGCKAWVNIPIEKRRKNMQEVALQGFFVSMSEEQPKCWGIWIPKLNKVEFSSDVVFDETLPAEIQPKTKKQEIEFYMRSEEKEVKDIGDFNHLTNLRYYDEDDRKVYETTRVATRGNFIVAYRKEVRDNKPFGNESDNHPVFVRDVEKMIENTRSEQIIQFNAQIEKTKEKEKKKEKEKEKEIDSHPRRHIRGREAALLEHHPQGEYIKSKEDAPLEHFHIGRDICGDENEPADIPNAVRNKYAAKWKTKMKEELDNIHFIKKVWHIDIPPPGVKPLGTRFVFKLKVPEDKTEPNIDDFRARLVVQGYAQKEGFDYHETFSPAARANTFRLFLYFVLLFEMTDPDHLDAVKAFMNSDIDCDVWVKPPYDPDRIFFQGTEVFKLDKALYGLKQAGRLWFTLIDKLLKGLGFKTVATEPCFYFSSKDGILTIVVVYVDDVMIASQSPELHKYFKRLIMQSYEFTDDGIVKEYLGVRVNIIRDEYFRFITLDQTRSIEKTAIRFRIMNERPARTPMVDKLVLSKDDELDDSDFPYRSWIGSALHISRWTRADISYAVGALARYNNHVTKKAIGAVIRLWVYLRDTSKFRLVIRLSDVRLDNYRLFGYSDSDFAADLDSRKSTSSWLLFIGNSLINWTSELERIIAQSTSEAELRCAGKLVNEITYMQNLFVELGILHESHKRVRQFCDNSGALQIIENPVFHKRTKHIEIPTFNIRDKTDEKKIIPTYVPTDQNPADIGTKNIDYRTLSKHRHNIGIIEFED